MNFYNTSSMEEIEKIYQILFSNQNKINYFRNSEDNNNSGINNFLNGLEIDIRNILSLLERIKFDISQNANKDIIICGNCDCCKICNCSTNNCSENKMNESNDKEYIKEIINPEENNNNDFNLNNLSLNNIGNYKTYQYINRNNIPKYNNNFNTQHQQYKYNNENNIIPIEEKYKNSAVMKSKRFHANKSLDNIKAKPSSPIRKAKIIRHYNLTEANNNINMNINNNPFSNNYDINPNPEKNSKATKSQKFLNKLYNQPKQIIIRFKSMYGIDIENKLLHNQIDDKTLNEMDNILNKIIKMSIWGEAKKKKKEKNKIKFNYNPIEEKVKLKQALENKQALYKEYPRGWYSTKEYFINNGTAINNDNAFI